MPTKDGARKEKEMDGLRPEYNISKLTGAVQGKYFREVTASTTLVVLEPDVAEAFPNARAVNDALRALAKGTTGKSKVPTKRLKPTSRKPRSSSGRRVPRAVRG